MKYPFELSHDRLSLLNEKERRIYNYEHSDYYSACEKEEGMRQFRQALLEKRGLYLQQINEDEDYDDMDEQEKLEMAEALAKYEAQVVMDDVAGILSEAFGDDEQGQYQIMMARGAMVHTMNDLKEMESNGVLNEADPLAPGADMTRWMKDMGWIGGLAAMALTGLMGGIITLIMAGKDAAAMDSLEKYMNKLVERVDEGIHKKRTLWGKLMGRFGFNNENDGDQSNACMRQIQENFSKQVACDGMVMLKNFGLLPDKTDSALSSVETNKYNGGGMQTFLQKVSFPVAKLSNKI